MINLPISHEMLRLIAEIDEFKGRWEALQTLSPERLRSLRHVATIESIGSSTRIEGVKLTDQQIATLLANLQRYDFKSRDEQEVAGYAYAALRKTQSTLTQAKPNWEARVLFFLCCLKKQKDNLSAKLQRERILAQALRPLSVTTLKLLREHERLTIADLE